MGRNLPACPPEVHTIPPKANRECRSLSLTRPQNWGRHASKIPALKSRAERFLAFSFLISFHACMSYMSTIVTLSIAVSNRVGGFSRNSRNRFYADMNFPQDLQSWCPPWWIRKPAGVRCETDLHPANGMQMKT